MRWQAGIMSAAFLAACATADAPRPATQAPSWPTLSRFSSEAEFLRYVADAAAARDARRELGAFAGKQSVEPECPPDDPACLGEEAEEAIVVTGSRIRQRDFQTTSPIASVGAEAMTNAQITNVQTAGVDEGDIVKMIGPYLIVLQDGRLFSIDTGQSAADLRFVDRMNVYRRSTADIWYDEMLVNGNRIVVTGYSYGEDATEFSVFSLSEDGRFTRESVYYLSSDDYYDTENYATRLVGGNLVIYTPLDVSEIDTSERPRWPLVRRWLRDGEERAVATSGRSLFDARDIYRPIQATTSPTIHTISVCPLGSTRAGDELDCRSTAIAGPGMREFYVSNDHVYLWLSHAPGYYGYLRSQFDRARCDARLPGSFGYAGEAALFQISLRDGRPRAMFVRGHPYDQMSFEATGDTLYALSVWTDPNCRDRPEDLPLRFLATPLSAFSTRPQAAAQALYTLLPSPGGAAMENRFAQGHLVYGGRERWTSYPPQDESDLSARIVAVPTANPRAAAILEAPHNLIRVESIGVRAVLTGYRDDSALSISVLDLQDTPRLTDTVRLEGRYESENRSHAFNASVDEHGAGLFGLPTVHVERRAGRWWWNSESSDLSFLSVGRDGRIAPLGELTSDSEESMNPGYSCEVSCIDWYGNSRPIFVRDRAFALSGVELIEGMVREGRIAEIGRVNFTAPPPRRTKH
ncbi:MAG: beta-propeller domain-containing protein [Hyphomonadaceae bacterium]|nr:beta-propeller domain-containing protein [Hyphomonadaceae bacterium]